MDRRTLLRAALAAPLTFASPPRRAVTGAEWRAIVRTSVGVVALDPTDGTTMPLRLPDTIRRAQWLPGVERLLLDRGGDVLIRDPCGAVLDRMVPAPYAVLAGRLIGDEEILLDLVTHRRHRLPDGIGPEAATLLHPSRPAAALDARSNGHGVLVLPAGSDRTPWSAEIPPEASVAIQPDGRSLLVSLPDGAGSSLHHVTRQHPAIDRPIVRADAPLLLLGPVGASGVVLAQIGEAALGLLDAAGQGQIVPMPGPGRVVSWQSDRGGEGILVAWDAAGEIGWWHLPVGEAAARRLEALPPNLVMAAMPGEARRWVHGASDQRDGLGSGELRLVAVAAATGEIALDVSVDRRLELAATAVRRDGTVLAHLQAGNTRVDLDVVALPGAMRRVSVPITGTPAAASEIDLRVEGDVVAAGLRWGDPDHHAPVVVGTGALGGEAVTIEGELLGVVPVGAFGIW